jgi:hypothetical protein
MQTQEQWRNEGRKPPYVDVDTQEACAHPLSLNAGELCGGQAFAMQVSAPSLKRKSNNMDDAYF